MKKEKLIEFAVIKPVYQTLPKASKLRGLRLLKEWVENEMQKLKDIE